jgi:hypothetical protein
MFNQKDKKMKKIITGSIFALLVMTGCNAGSSNFAQPDLVSSQAIICNDNCPPPQNPCPPPHQIIPDGTNPATAPCPKPPSHCSFCDN